MTFGSKGSRDGQFLGPTGIAIDSTGIVFIADWDNHRVQLFSPNGKFIGKFGSLGMRINLHKIIIVNYLSNLLLRNYKRLFKTIVKVRKKY